jgi:hypothetical protein
LHITDDTSVHRRTGVGSHMSRAVHPHLPASAPIGFALHAAAAHRLSLVDIQE